MKTFTTFAYIDVGDGKATLAIRETEYEPGEGKNTIEVAVAFCSPNDQFSRRIGRDVAFGRLNAKSRFYGIAVRNPDVKLKVQAEAMFQQLLGNENVVYNYEGLYGWQAARHTISKRKPVIISLRPKMYVPRWVVKSAMEEVA